MKRLGFACAIAAMCGCGFDHGDSDITGDAPTPTAVSVGFSAESSTTSESQSVDLVVSLSSAADHAVTVAYAVTGGTASSADATVTGSTITFMPGETSRTIAVAVTDDSIDEPDETVMVTLSDPVAASLAATSASTLTITDDDSSPTVALAQATASVAEEVTTVNVTVQLSGESAFAISVPFTIAGSADNPEDFTLGGGATVMIPAGQTSATIAVHVKADDLDEADETVIVNLGTPTNATAGAVTSATLTITDDDDAPIVAFTSKGSNPNEGDSNITLTVQLSDISGQNVAIPYSLDPNSTAADPADYTISPSLLLIPAGSTSTTLTIAMKEDTDVELDETVIVVLGTPVNATLGTPATYTLTIKNDD